jgi:hypothetical protein
MHVRLATALGAAVLIGAGATAAGAAQRQQAAPAAPDDVLVSSFDNLTRGTAWTRTQTIDLGFHTFHPQSMEVIGDRIFLSSVEITQAPVKYPNGPVGGYDRTPGKGVGHLFILDRSGKLLKDIVLGEGDMYHPGGIDYDGEHIWVPVSEYRPNSAGIVYRVDAETYRAKEMFRVKDHVGGVVRDQETGRLVGQSWGSRRFYEWTPAGEQKDFWLNENHFIDYQDCEYVATGNALCSGVTGLPAQPGAATGYELGGFAMIDLRDEHRIRHEVPVQLWSTAGHVVTRNPTDLDAEGSHLTMYAAPDDFGEGANTQVLVYEADVTPQR